MTQGLPQFRAEARRFARKYIDRNGLLALTAEAAKVSGLPRVKETAAMEKIIAISVNPDVKPGVAGSWGASGPYRCGRPALPLPPLFPSTTRYRLSQDIYCPGDGEKD
jgi:hypothetical protein